MKKKIIRLTESELINMIENVISEQIYDSEKLWSMTGSPPDKGRWHNRPQTTSPSNQYPQNSTSNSFF